MVLNKTTVRNNPINKAKKTAAKFDVLFSITNFTYSTTALQQHILYSSISATLRALVCS
jgi:hypothetical protein